MTFDKTMLDVNLEVLQRRIYSNGHDIGHAGEKKKIAP
jgi:hypothetical protein